MKLTICILILISVSCTVSEQNRYEDNFKKYLSEVHNLAIPLKGVMTYYIINANECEDCIDIHLTSIRSHKFTTPVTIIIVGKVLKIDWINIIQDIKNRKNLVLHDVKGEGMVYDIGLQKPITIKFESGSLVKLTKIMDRDIQTNVTSL